MKMNKSDIFAKFEEVIKLQGFLLVDIVFRGDNKNIIIEVFIDSEKGVNVSQCADISRSLNTLIEEENLIESNYRLDVSSPGVDRPLKYLVQYPKHINRKFEISFSEGEETGKFVGKLIKIEDDNLYFSEGKNERIVNFSNIQKANVLISF
ncbi:ribosome maturation factor RimP [Bacteroidota bacterium]